MNRSTIADFCIDTGITQREIAVKMGYTLRQIQKFINDERNGKKLGLRQKANFERVKEMTRE